MADRPCKSCGHVHSVLEPHVVTKAPTKKSKYQQLKDWRERNPEKAKELNRKAQADHRARKKQKETE